jgi:threonine aldolase
MRDAMAHAVVGDEIFNDDPTTKRLEQEIASILGKERALLTTSGV